MERVMSDLGLPSWLTDALRGAGRAHTPTPKGWIEPGDLCRLAVDASGDVPADARLLLVLDVDTDAGIASVMMAHTDYEIRTNLDVLVRRDETGLAFDLAVATDLVGPVALGSLGTAPVGAVPGDLLDQLRDAVDFGELPYELRDRVGMPLRGELDARWAWKIAEGEALDRLLTAHAPALVEAVSPVQQLADAFRALGRCSDREDDLGVITDCSLAFIARRETPPADILYLFAQPGMAAALGNDRMRAFMPMLRVA